jgi:hypothetical protein
LKPDRTTVLLDHALTNGQPHAATGVLTVGMKSLEEAEDLFGELGVDSDSVVND